MLPGDPLWTGDPTSMGLKNVRLHSQNNSAAVRFPSVALAGEDEAAHPGKQGMRQADCWPINVKSPWTTSSAAAWVVGGSSTLAPC